MQLKPASGIGQLVLSLANSVCPDQLVAIVYSSTNTNTNTNTNGFRCDSACLGKTSSFMHHSNKRGLAFLHTHR
jgi:hypothetical protein